MSATAVVPDVAGLDLDQPKVALMVITDGRWDYLEQTLASFEEQCDFPFGDFVIVNDSGEPFPFDRINPRTWWHGDASYAATVLGGPRNIGCDQELVPVGRRGLAGAIQTGWDHIFGITHFEYVFHLEDDFTFPQRVPLREMLSALVAYPSLAQVALKRQPWSPQEQLAGNMLLLKPDLEQIDNLCVHDSLFTFNPCLYPREITRYGAGLEQELTDKLTPDGWRFAYYGGKHDPPRCIHIGHRRSEGYRW